MHPLPLVVIALAAQAEGSSFRTEIVPRLDPAFGDIAGLRRSVDRSLALERDMQAVADQFAVAVQETLAALGAPVIDPGREALAKATNEKRCRASVGSAYERAKAAGARYLTLGRELEQHMRELHSAESYGDTVGLTPDYRIKVERSRGNHAELLRSLREMQAAFHDQLEAEMRYAGCPTGEAIVATLPLRDDDGSAAKVPAPSLPARAGQASPPAPAAPLVGIEIDSSHCPEASRVTVDGKPVGLVEGQGRAVVRVGQGPHDICVLPSSDVRTCGEPGTVRHAYVHDGWVLEVRCGG